MLTSSFKAFACAFRHLMSNLYIMSYYKGLRILYDVQLNKKKLYIIAKY